MYTKSISENIIDNRPKWLWMILLLLFVVFWVPSTARSDNDLMEIKVPEALNPAFEHLMALTVSGGTTGFNPVVIGGLLDFVTAPKEEDKLYYVDGTSKATSAYYEFAFDTGLAHVLKLSYNPALPSFITNPSSVRLSFWSEFGGGRQNLPKLWDYLEDLGESCYCLGSGDR